MNQISRKWLEFANSDLRNAEILFRNKSYKDAIWYSHQAIEKLLKAIISNQGKRVPKIHDLVGLLEESNFSQKDTVSNFLEELNPYYIPTRYPEAGFNFKITYTRIKTKEILNTAKEVFKWLRMALSNNKRSKTMF